jgi:hypothetical protein
MSNRRPSRGTYFVMGFVSNCNCHVRARSLVSDTSCCPVYRGFPVCPIFWVIGAAILRCDLNPLPQAIGDKSAAEQAEELAIMRASELMWARRSLYAIIVFSVVAGSLVYALFLMGPGPSP